MTHSKAVDLICEMTGYKRSEISASDDAQSLDLWDSIAHVNIILAVEATIKRPLLTSEIIEMSSVMGVQKVIETANEQ